MSEALPADPFIQVPLWAWFCYLLGDVQVQHERRPWDLRGGDGRSIRPPSLRGDLRSAVQSLLFDHALWQLLGETRFNSLRALKPICMY